MLFYYNFKHKGHKVFNIFLCILCSEAYKTLNYFCLILFHTNAIIKNNVAVNTIAAPDAMLK